MKNFFLVNEMGVPESVIIVDPYARHSTTNFRNAARLLLQAGAPLEKEVLVAVVHQGHLAGGISQSFTERCIRELGYEPITERHQVSSTSWAGHLNPMSLTLDPADPLDP
jgi:hypothetical protein